MCHSVVTDTCGKKMACRTLREKIEVALLALTDLALLDDPLDFFSETSRSFVVFRTLLLKPVECGRLGNKLICWCLCHFVLTFTVDVCSFYIGNVLEDFSFLNVCSKTAVRETAGHNIILSSSHEASNYLR